MLVTCALVLLCLSGCDPSVEDLESITYAPLSRDDGWTVSTPEAEGPDPMLVARLFYFAQRVQTIKALLVIRNGHLIAEGYFNGGGPNQSTKVQSVAKSYVSALVGIALDQGYIQSLDQKMLDFFPELEGQIRDPRKRQITIRQLLEMRAGYPWEESSKELFDVLYRGFKPSDIVDIPLVRDPGTGFDYSNLSPHILSIIVTRATGMDVLDFAQQVLTEPIGSELTHWTACWEGYRCGHAEIFLPAREMAKFGLLYLNDGVWNGDQVIPASWVQASLRSYSQDAWYYRIGKNYDDVGYGFLWWSAVAGDQPFNFAWGHGGQQITLVKEHHLVIVVKSDPLHGQHGGTPWKWEKENLNLVANFIAELP